MHYLLFYEVGEDYVSRRAEFRGAHLEKAWQASERGELLLGGALAEPLDSAVLLFKGDSPQVAENFARDDPYVTNGLVKRWRVREWTTVVGDEAARPIRPNASACAKESARTPSTLPGTDPSLQAKSMILRMWKARSTQQQWDQYAQHATKKVFPGLQAIEGYRGAYLLRRLVGDAVETVVMTLWDSMEAVRRFAGPKPDRAVVGPEARGVLTDFDEFVTHYEVVHSPEGMSKKEP